MQLCNDWSIGVQCFGKFYGKLWDYSGGVEKILVSAGTYGEMVCVGNGIRLVGVWEVLQK